MSVSHPMASEIHQVDELGRLYLALRHQLDPDPRTAAVEARLLLAHAVERSPDWVLAHPKYRLSAAQKQALQAALARLADGEPLPVILGRWEFFGLSLRVTPEVLIPRPETELLVETAIQWLTAHPHRRRMVDVGTGSGCIAISLATRFPDLRVVASDISLTALQVARENARQHRVRSQVKFVQAHLLAAAGVFDLICANLPYIPSDTLQHLEVFGREPTLALNGGQDGLALIRPLLQQAPSHLAPGGLLLMEIEASQGAAVQQIVRRVFPAARISLQRDLANKDRLLVVQDQAATVQDQHP